MRSDRPAHDVDRLRDEVHDLARENAELRALVERQPGGSAAELPSTELERRKRVLRRVTFNLVLLAIGVAVAIFSALRINGP